MKKILVIFLLISSIGFSQETIKVKLGDFNEIKVFSRLKITLKKAKVAGIEISGSKAVDVVYKNINGRLKISMRLPQTFNADEANIIVYYDNELDLIDANEGAIIVAKDKIKQEKITLKSQEGAVINLNIKVKFLTIRVVTGAVITLEGMVNSQDIEANTGGTYYGFYLKSNTTTALSASGARVEVSVEDVLDATVRLGGSIYYKDTPSEIIKEKILGGTIKSED